MLEDRSPASSLMDLAYLGLATATDPFATPANRTPFVATRPGLDLGDGFDRPLTWAVPADAGKMADTQSPTGFSSPAADRRGGLLEIDDAAPERQPTFTLPAFTWQPPAPAGDAAPVSQAHAVGAPAEPAATLPAFLAAPAPTLPAKEDAPRSDPDIVSLPSSSYMTGPLPGGYVTGLKVQEVDFVGDAITVKADPGRTPYPGGPVVAPAVRGPEWRDGNIDGQVVDGPHEWAVPTAIARDKKPVVSAKFVVTGLGNAPNPAPAKTLKIRGIWQGTSLMSKEQVVAADAKVGDIITYPPMETVSPVPNYVDSVRAANIVWQYQIQGDMTWYWAGNSSNEMFVVLDRVAAFSVEPYHTVISLSTRASTYATTPEEVVSDTYDQFRPLHISTVMPAYLPPNPAPINGKPAVTGQKLLHYYKDWLVPGQDTEALLRDSDGKCNAWSSFLKSTLDAHGGIGGRGFWVTPIRQAPQEFMLVTHWQFNGPGTSLDPAYPYKNEIPANGPYEVNNGGVWGYEWGNAVEVHHLTTAAPGSLGRGQGPTKPRNLFNEHALVLIDGKFYDPSYGTGPFDDLPAWETASLDGFMQSPNPQPNPPAFHFRLNSPVVLDVKEGRAPRS